MTNTLIVCITIVVIVGVAIVEVWALRRVNWKQRLTNPVIVAAIVAGATTLAVTAFSAAGSIVSSAISSSSQKATEIEKNKTNALLSIVLQYDPKVDDKTNDARRSQGVKYLIESGILADENGSICLTFINTGCPLQVKKPN
jgi:Kef-type K+ transport system membrane component KefB